MFQGIFGNSTEINPVELQKDLDALLADGEHVVRAFKLIRDMFIFTDKRLILIDKQGITGRKAEYHSIPYKSISQPTSLPAASTFVLVDAPLVKVGCLRLRQPNQPKTDDTPSRS